MNEMLDLQKKLEMLRYENDELMLERYMYQVSSEVHTLRKL
jgi:hypothetical protein